MQRYFLTQTAPTNTAITLPSTVAHHLVTVLRAKIGTRVEIVASDHHVYSAHVVNLSPAKVVLDADLNKNSEMPVAVILACGIPKTATKLDLIVQKGTELGANRIVFFAAQRSVSHWTSKKRDKKIARLQKIARAASEQSHRNLVPTIQYGGTLANLLDKYQATVRLVAWEESAKQGEKSQLVQAVDSLHPGDSLLAIFGPEGGLTAKEVAMMNEQGVKACGLGPRILRTETAPLYFLAAVSTLIELSVANNAS